MPRKQSEVRLWKFKVPVRGLRRDINRFRSSLSCIWTIVVSSVTLISQWATNSVYNGAVIELFSVSRKMTFLVVCGPGKYYGQIEPTNNYCRAFYGKTRACVQCPGNKVKSVSGNSQSLCVGCDGTITVPNSDRSGCSKYD